MSEEQLPQIDLLIAIWSNRPCPGSQDGDAWIRGARQGWKWAHQQSDEIESLRLQLASARKALEAFRNADAQDWNYLNYVLGYDAHGRFWRLVMAELRAALKGMPK